jgi:hypothetical protein
MYALAFEDFEFKKLQKTCGLIIVTNDDFAQGIGAPSTLEWEAAHLVDARQAARRVRFR